MIGAFRERLAGWTGNGIIRATDWCCDFFPLVPASSLRMPLITISIHFVSGLREGRACDSANKFADQLSDILLFPRARVELVKPPDEQLRVSQPMDCHTLRTVLPVEYGTVWLPCHVPAGRVYRMLHYPSNCLHWVALFFSRGGVG